MLFYIPSTYIFGRLTQVMQALVRKNDIGSHVIGFFLKVPLVIIALPLKSCNELLFNDHIIFSFVPIPSLSLRLEMFRRPPHAVFYRPCLG